MKLRILLCLTLLGCGAAGARAAELTYTVEMPRPETHYFHVTLRMEENRDAAIRLVMPAWTPGSYIIREYAKFVEDFSAQAEGKALPWQKADKHTWVIGAGKARAVEVRYKVYANDLSVRGADLDDEHGYFNGAALFMYAVAQKNRPYRLKLVPHDSWKVATGLEAVAGQTNVFEAPDFDTLVDCPVEISAFERLEFQVQGVPHWMVIHGPAKFDREKMTDAFRRIVETQAAMMRELPYKHYTFLMHLGLPAGGGLEHFNSTSINSSRMSFRQDTDWEAFLDLVSHEYFHHWNVKRIRPAALGPFDYTQENYTRALWISEGITDYYSLLILARAGLITPKKYYKGLTTLIQNYRETPGRLRQSAEASSFDTWIKLYRQTENSVNTEISYYDKGALLGLLLDLEIRRRTGNAKSLDDVMRQLNENYARKGRGFPEEDFQKVAEQMAGGSLAEFFAAYVSGVKELPLEQALETAGLLLAARKPAEKEEDRQKEDSVELGIRTSRSGDRTLISRVIEGLPAWAAGVNAGDELLALDGIRVGDSDYRARLQEYAPGGKVRITVFRDNKLKELEAVLGPPLAKFEITEIEKPDEMQSRIRKDWLGIRP